jgi:hypothetical protein
MPFLDSFWKRVERNYDWRISKVKFKVNTRSAGAKYEMNFTNPR